MQKDKKNKKATCKCRQCQFFDKQTNSCEVRNIKNFNKKDITECDDFLANEKLIMF